MIHPTKIAKLILAELDRLKREQHWGELKLEITVKNGDPQQLAVVNTRTFRDLEPQPSET